MPDPKMRPGFIIAASVLVVLLVVSLFGLTSLNLPFINPSDSAQTILLFVLSTIIFLGLVIFGFILFRSLLKLYLERRANQLGSKFKTKLVCGALGLSLLPVIFLFLFSYSLINRTLDKWFSRPFETMSQDTGQVVEMLRGYAKNKAVSDAENVAFDLAPGTIEYTSALTEIKAKFQKLAARPGIDFVAVLDSTGKVLFEHRTQADFPLLSALPNRDVPLAPSPSSTLFDLRGTSYVLGVSPIKADGSRIAFAVVGSALPQKVSEAAARLNLESVIYGNLSRERKFIRRIYISILLLLTVVILFIATWFALFLSRQVTVPIQALAEATHEVSKGNLHFRVRAKATDELGILVRSFNEMTEQLSASRSEIELSRSDLQQTNAQLDQRNRFTQAILESIPSGVISLSGNGSILASNSAAQRLFGRELSNIAHLDDLFGPDDAREISYLMKRAARMGQASHQGEMHLDGKNVNLAITLSALAGEESSGAASGRFVAIFEDMTELLRAERAVAWGEVAQRIAHEIKNPLTPIALSAERISLWADRQLRNADSSPDIQRVVQESCTLIKQEVETLKRLVDEFSQFSRFPKAVPAPANMNQIIENTISLFNGRLDGIRIRTSLAADLPTVLADASQFRRVFVNLIDNAAAAMEGAMVRELRIVTRTDMRRELVEVIVSDTGHGVSPEDKEKLFLPYFSTKDRGTGLGLAIVSKIVSEHDGVIRVEKNDPVGAKFVIELPVAQTVVA